MSALKPAYTYAAIVLRWVDGDTVDLQIDLGFHMVTEDRFRLYGIDTPERGQPNHDEATALCAKLAPPGSIAVVKTYKGQDKYGRYLADIFPGDGTTASVNTQLLLAGLAKVYFGGTKT